HGNRAASSRAGSADVLEELGVPLDLPPAAAARAIEETGFAFLFAPRYHPALAAVAGLRKALGVRTVFNLMGPLLNPAGARRQVVGVFDESLLELYAEVLIDLGAESAMVVRAEDGMDELSLCAPTHVCWAERGRPPRRERIAPEDAGLRRAATGSLRGGSAAENAKALVALLLGEAGPRADAVALNAGAALLVSGLAKDLREGVALARESLASGAARKVLARARKAGEKARK
ncbi:MAG TPA: anthranilate phosphoribosyltransferase, partial [Elusimicrobiota bacterium]|nr:anthranilate phosphoribosyltransferase [Elusimicrobiota bacterium]